MATQEADMLEQIIVAELPRWIAAHPTLRALAGGTGSERAKRPSADDLPRIPGLGR